MKSPKPNRRPSQLAMDGGMPIRRTPLPLEFPGTYFYGKQELDLVSRVIRARSPNRYYGLDLQYMTEQFEREFAKFVGVPHALAVNSGTAALAVGMMALGIGPGDEVIVPGYMWVSTVGAVVRLGAIPVLADIDETFCLDPKDVERKINKRTRVVVLVHMSGATGNVAPIVELCRKYKIHLLEDVAQAAGASAHGKRLGSFGDISIFSFQLNKPMTTGEGGAVCTRTKQLHDRAFAAHCVGYPRNAAGRLDLKNLEFATWGYGARMNEPTAALALAQLGKLPKICASMRERKHKLKKMLSDIPGLSFRRLDDPEGEAGSFLLTIFPDAAHANFFVKALRAEGIVPQRGGISNIRMTDWGLHIYHHIPSLVNKLPVSGGNNPWKDPRNRASQRVCYSKGTLPRCDDLISRTLLLCIPPVLTNRDVKDISDAYHKVAEAHPLL
ncbi:MAG: DegT/DnrJ/EryC1/StrS family aminotransferase [Verrucomicrobia bacterium]|nr:DegT/DnrJ/EryC1/StrS family aminotransferase [Verrucomicrobiota bacterium]